MSACSLRWLQQGVWTCRVRKRPHNGSFICAFLWLELLFQPGIYRSRQLMEVTFTAFLSCHSSDKANELLNRMITLSLENKQHLSVSSTSFNSHWIDADKENNATECSTIRNRNKCNLRYTIFYKDGGTTASEKEWMKSQGVRPML